MKSGEKRTIKENSLKTLYRETAVAEMIKQFGYKSPMQVPRLERIVVNIGIGKWLDNKEVKARISRDIASITGQKPVFTRAGKAIAGFKIKVGQEVGISATLRGGRMYDFLERLIVGTLPRIRDFRGISKNNFSDQGNVSIGIKEQIVFPEIDSENADIIFSLQVSIVTTASTKDEGIALLKLIGFPVRMEEETGIVEHIKSKREEAKEKEAKVKKEKKSA